MRKMKLFYSVKFVSITIIYPWCKYWLFL